MNILLPTDSFPPNCGGSGWSTYDLARGLVERGHTVLVVKVVAGKSGAEVATHDNGIRVLEYHAYAPAVPGVRNYFKNERLYPRLAQRLEELIDANRIDLVHGQHVLSAPPSVMAATRRGIPSVVTIRDYWPVCYKSDLIHTTGTLALCPGCSRAAGVQHDRPRLGVIGFARTAAQTYLRRNMAQKIATVASASAVIAVSSVIARDLLARAPELSRTRIEVIPNPVNVTALLRAAETQRPLPDPYALYVGKLAVNKGTDHLVDVIQQADLDWPLVIVGDGPDRNAVESAARASACDVRFEGWLNQAETGRWIAHAGLLIFPSRGPESLSRVLLEASARGIPIAAMNTGGTADIVEDEITGLLSDSPSGLADDVRRLRHGEVLRQRLGAAAAKRTAEKFDSPAVISRIEALYGDVMREPRW
ncbi:MAG: glycosyltransferase family 4 protein [Acidobacteriota bacterium]|nr:glycosyltransferase family 4 protein [Acidobacteriota bacterium]